jgi:SAM-dependent methyltransferase
MATVLVEVGAEAAGHPLATVDELAEVADLRIYNTEAHGALHERLSRSPGYVASEYFGPDLASGDLGPGGLLHQDLQHLSFAPSSFDLVVSTDVFEHVADPYQGHSEVFRVLRPGGHHVFTVPFDEGSALDDVRATRRPNGSIELLAEPLYHLDPVRVDEGALVFTIFGLEMLVKLARLGFDTTAYRLWDPGRGLVGPGLVFDALRRL